MSSPGTPAGSRPARGHGFKPLWAWSKPIPTVGCTFGGVGGKQSGGHYNLSIQEATLAQGFPADYPWQGTLTKQYEQIGNAIPPPLGAAIVSALIKGEVHQSGDIIDTFAGPGGWSQGLRMLGLHDLGIEKDKDACATRLAAGHKTLQAEVDKLDPMDFDPVWGFIASPPCQAFSAAGKQLGLEDVRGQLVFEVVRWVKALQPEWIACEQVKEVLPIWKAFGQEFQEMGYNVWTGILNAADYGVPQTRKRAILMASRNRFNPPAPTHTENPAKAEAGDLFGTSLLPWITMAEALGWGITDQPAGPVMARAHDENDKPTGGVRPLDGGAHSRARYRKAQEEGRWIVNTRAERKTSGGNEFDASENPSWALTEKARSWKRRFDTPEGDPGEVPGWPFDRPSTTIVGTFRPDIVAAPGWRNAGDGPRQNASGSVPIDIEEAGILQTFPADYPWQGARTKQFLQVGNAVPPLLGAHIIKELVK